MAEVTVTLPDSEYENFPGNYVDWQLLSGRPSLGMTLSEDSAAELYLGQVRLFDSGVVGLNIEDSSSGGFSGSDDLSTQMEQNGTITFTASDGETLVVTGISDSTDPYSWTPTNSAEVIAFANHIRGLFSAGQRGLTVTFNDNVPTTPDLTVDTPTRSPSGDLTPGESFTLSTTVRNEGDGSSPATTLRWRRSTNTFISTSDPEVGTDAVGTLAAGGTSAESITLTAPSSPGTYYYGATVDSVTGESDTGNNRSGHQTVVVLSSLTAPSFADDTGDSQSWTVGNAISPLTVPAASGNPTPTYAVVGSLPAGLAFSTGSRRISGTPTSSGSGTIRIRATNSEGDDDWTVSYNTAGAAPVAPGPPSTPSLTAGIERLTATWSAPSAPGTHSITSYDVRYRQGISGSWTTINPATSGSRTYTITGLDAGSSYQVEVRAVSAAGDGAWSGTASGVPTVTGVPSAPTSVSLVPSTSPLGLTISWDIPSSDGGMAITTYETQHRVSPDGPSFLLQVGTQEIRQATLAATGLPPQFSQYQLTAGETYDVRIRANNGDGVLNIGVWSAWYTATVPGSGASEPTITALTSADSALAVQWSLPSDDGGSPITFYDVRYRIGSSSWTTIDSATMVGRRNYTIAMLTNGIEYEVQVRAVNAIGNGAWSDSESATPVAGTTLVIIQDPDAPDMPILVRPVAPGRAEIITVRSGNHELTVTWEAPDEEGTNGIDYYDLRIRSAASSRSPEEVEEFTVLDRIAPDDREHTIKGLANHVEFEVQVRAVSVNITTDNIELALQGAWSEGVVGIPEPEREAAQGVVRIVTWDDRIWGITADGRIMDTFDLANSWTERAAIPRHYTPVTDAFVFNDVRGEPSIFIMTEDGMWIYDGSNERVLQTDVTYPQAPDRGRGTVVWQGNVFIPVGNGIWRWSGGSSPVLDLVGPDRDSGLPWDGESRIVKLVRSTNHLIAAVQNTDARDAPVGTSHVLAYNGIGWQVLWTADPDDGTVVLNDVFVGEILGEYSLWLGHDDLEVIDLPIDIVNPARLNWRRRYASEGYLITPWFDANEVELDKLAIEWKVDASNLSATETFKIECAVDFEDTWHEILTIPTQKRLEAGTPDGYYRLQIPDAADEDPIGFLWKAVRFRVTATSANAEITPDLHMIGLEFKPRLDTVWGFSVPVNLNEGTGNRNPKQLREELTKALSDKKMVKLEYGGETFYAELESGDLTHLAGSAEDGDAPVTALQLRELRQAE